MKKYKYIFIALFFFSSTEVFAESWYQVEVIIFVRINPDLQEEQWENQEPRIRPDMIELYPNYAINSEQQLAPYMTMDKKNNRMSGVYRSLKMSAEYRPLIHLSWQQPAANRRQSRHVHITKYENEGDAISEKNLEKSEEPDFIENIRALEKIIDGSIRIRSNFYLHADLELYYFRDVLDEKREFSEEFEQTDINYKKLIIKLEESRKIKLNEIHYFDNPMYGVILQVSRLGES